jgi:hypothetical protein
LTFHSLAAPGAVHFATVQSSLLDNRLTSTLLTVVIFVTAFLVILNASLAIVSRKKRALQVGSFILACLLELLIFALALVLRLGIMTHVPFNLPPGLPINQAEIGTTLALAIGLFPAAYWQGTSLSTLRQRMEEDAKVIKNREGGVRIRGNGPGEWLN